MLDTASQRARQRLRRKPSRRQRNCPGIASRFVFVGWEFDAGTTQRSVVRQITVNFDSEVVLDPGVFEIERVGGGVFDLRIHNRISQRKNGRNLDGDGDVDGRDYGHFGKRFLKKLPG